MLPLRVCQGMRFSHSLGPEGRLCVVAIRSKSNGVRTEIIVSMSEDGSAIHFPLCGMRHVKPSSIENSFARTNLGFNFKSNTFWKVELVQFKYKSHLKVVSQDQWVLSISVHFPICVSFIRIRTSNPVF